MKGPKQEVVVDQCHERGEIVIQIVKQGMTGL